eukprot:278255_1
MPTNLRIFVEFEGYFLPILGDSGIYHVFPIPPNCSTINDVAYEIIKKYELTPLAPDGIDLKINNKYVLLPRDNVQNTIREGDELHISPRVIQSKWNNHKQTISKKRKSNSIEDTNTNTNTENNHNTDTISTDINHIITHTPPTKKRKISNINSATSISTSVISTGTSASSSVTCYSSSDSDDNLNHNNINPLADIPEENNHNNTNINDTNDTNDESSSSDDTEDSSSDSSDDSIHKTNINNKQENNDIDIIMNNNNIMNAENINESINNNINGNNNVSSTDSDSESDSMSSESDSEQDNEDKPPEQIQIQVQEQVDNKIENGDIVTLNDALNMVKNCKDKIINNNNNNNENENVYLRSVKVNDRIKVCIDNEWKCGIVKGVFADSIVE